MIGDVSSKKTYGISSDRTPAATGYEIPFQYPNANSIRVYTTGNMTDTEVSSSNYSVDTSGATPKVLFNAGYMFPEGNTKVTIIRNLDYTQGLDLRNGDTIDADKLEEALDDIIMQVQQVEEKTTRAVLSSVSDTVQIRIPEASSRGGMLLGFDENGAAVPILTADIQQKLSQALGAEEHTITLESQAQAAKGLAEEWASKTSGKVTGTNEYSAKKNAIDAANSASAAESWASQESGTIGNTGLYSARKYAKDAYDTYQEVIAYVGPETTPTTALGQIKSAKEGALAAIGEDDQHGARSNALSAISSALTNANNNGALQQIAAKQETALSAIGRTDNEGARKDAIDAIGIDDQSGKRGDAISAISDAKTNALSAIGEDDSHGARKNALNAIGTDNSSGKRGDAISAITEALGEKTGENSGTGALGDIETARYAAVGSVNEEVSDAIDEYMDDTVVPRINELIESIPADFSELEATVTAQSRRILTNEYEIKNLRAVTKGDIYSESTESTSSGTLALPTTYPLAPYGTIDKVTGKTIVWNQKLDGTCKGATYDSSAKTYTLAYTSSYKTVFFPYSPISLISGHKYLQCLDLKIISSDGNSLSIRGRSGDTLYGNIQTTSNTVYRSVITADDNATAYHLRVDTMSSSSGEIVVTNPMLFDLTQMFGSAITGKSDAEILAMAKAEISCHSDLSYNAGELGSSRIVRVESKPFNIWDEEWELGVFNVTTGEASSSGNSIRSKNPIKVSPNTTYYAKGNAGMWIMYLDADKNVITGISSSSSLPNIVSGNKTTFTTTSNTMYIMFYIGSYGTSYNNDVCINRSCSSNGTYKPHLNVEESSQIATLPSITLRSVGTVADEYVPEAGKVTRKIGSVDLGTVSQYIDGTFRVAPSDIKQVRGSAFVCSAYTNSGVVSIPSGMADRTAQISDKIFIKDSRYTDLESFKSAMDGVMLYYELDTTYEETPAQTPIDHFIGVEAGGTISVDSNDAQAEATITYQTDLTQS